jgi:hypothetical protein
MKDYIIYIDDESVGTRRAANAEELISFFHYTQLEVVKEEVVTRGMSRIYLRKVG